jgi:hypothetical protein
VTDQAQSEPRKVRTAFLVVQNENHEWEATPLHDLPLDVEHRATVAEMKHGASEVASDIEASKTAAMAAQLVVQQQMQMAMAARSQATDQAIRSQLHLPK